VSHPLRKPDSAKIITQTNTSITQKPAGYETETKEQNKLPVDGDRRVEGPIKPLPDPATYVDGDQDSIGSPQGGVEGRSRSPSLPEIVCFITQHVISVLQAKQPRFQLPTVGDTLLSTKQQRKKDSRKIT